MQSKALIWSVSLAVLLALVVVMLGAYTRLSDAGLGCPDWPGCYGHMLVQAAPESPKAWTEMIHRYFAGTLALLIFYMAFMVTKHTGYPRLLPWILVVLVFGQAALGMWTVTMKLWPIVVMAHLLGGMLIFAILCRFRVQLSSLPTRELPTFRPWIRLGLFIVFLQIALGGWVSANYAGTACVGFPLCNGVWLPPLHFSQGLHLFTNPGANFQGGVLDNAERLSIQYIHRLGALVTALYSFGLAAFLFFKSKLPLLKIGAGILLLEVVGQLFLGALNVIYFLPMAVAVLHNAMAALILATLLCLLHFTYRRAR